GHGAADGRAAGAPAAHAGLPARDLRRHRGRALAAAARRARPPPAQRAGALAPPHVSPLVALSLRFTVLSLVAVGGVTSVLPEVHRVVVDVNHWMTDVQFAQAFAIAQASPGPNMLIVTIIGWHVAALPGALVATAAMITPCATLSYSVARVWQRFQGAAWRRIVEAGLAPVTVGLTLGPRWRRGGRRPRTLAGA